MWTYEKALPASKPLLPTSGGQRRENAVAWVSPSRQSGERSEWRIGARPPRGPARGAARTTRRCGGASDTKKSAMGRYALPLLVLAAALQAEDDRPDRRADANLQPRINDAISRGVEYLKSIQKPDGSWTYASDRFEEDMTAGLTALALYALSASRVPADDPVLRKGVRWTETKRAFYTPAGAYSTYSASLLVLALTRIDPEEHATRIHRLAESIVDGQLGNDMWSYRLSRSRTRDKVKAPEEGAVVLAGDNSNSQFAILAIWAASALADFDVSPRTWERIQSFYGRTQLPNGAWGYIPGPLEGTGSMTSAGLCSYVYATAGLLGGVPGLPAARADPVATRGVDALLADVQATSFRNYYFAYALERAGTVMAIPEERWYIEGARALVAQQDGSGRWGGVPKGPPNAAGSAGAYETSLALLFLSRATRGAITRGGAPDGNRRVARFPDRVGTMQLEEALLYYTTAAPDERRTLAPRFAEAGTAAAGFLVGKLRASDRESRCAAWELTDTLFDKRFLFDPNATAEQRDVMLMPIETYWQEHREKIQWDGEKHRFAVP